ncbi:hypothetical protein B0H16DRAFT_1591997 [Mycena metata]|uniref:Secreted protein n=1 Tax=Mycena metata TaxID=1033252 RepID=A0AAD7HRR6_9AGAR|nr:hypothetical protein B0H16DRAFT_1615110 [Mycena metata]KAJ7726768.1 hypothetical protein B0H16DRAFT_1591997 [Mycena metata]
MHVLIQTRRRGLVWLLLAFSCACEAQKFKKRRSLIHCVLCLGALSFQLAGFDTHSSSSRQYPPCRNTFMCRPSCIS